MILLHVLGLFVFPELQSVLNTLNIFWVRILWNLNGSYRGTITNVIIRTIRHYPIYYMSLVIVMMDLTVLLLLCLQSLEAIYPCIFRMDSIKGHGNPSLIEILIIIVIFGFRGYNLNVVFISIFVKPKLLYMWMMTSSTYFISV